MIKRDGGTADSISLIQTETFKIYSTSQFPFQLLDFTFVSIGANVNDGEVTAMIKVFEISGGWDTLRVNSTGIGVGIPDLSQAYKNAAARGHRAAHGAAFNYDYPWIAEIKNEILAIAASLDILLMARCRQITTQPALKLNSHNITSALNYKFLELKMAFIRKPK